MPELNRHVFVCINERDPKNPKGCCRAKGGAEVYKALKAKLAVHKLKGIVRVNSAGCLGQCAVGVVVVVYPEQIWYQGVGLDDVDELIQEHILAGRVVERLLMPNQGARRKLPPLVIGHRNR